MSDRLTPMGGASPLPLPASHPGYADMGGGEGERAGAAIIMARARACVGVRFRPQGRDPALGLDCVGLAAAALGREARADYAMRFGDAGAVAAMIAAAGLTRAEEARAGDLLLMRSGPGQLHLAIQSEDGIIHADAGARRVVERPGAAPWPVVGAWRAVDSSEP